MNYTFVVLIDDTDRYQVLVHGNTIARICLNSDSGKEQVFFHELDTEVQAAILSTMEEIYYKGIR